MRRKHLVNHDSQKRCYNGAYFDASMEWGEFETLESEVEDAEVEARLEFWRALNSYAVSQRGEDARKEFCYE